MIETYSPDQVEDEVMADIELAKALALGHAFPTGKNAKIGCVLKTPLRKFKGANIKRWAGNSNTCAERMATDQAIFSGARELTRYVVYGIDEAHPTTEVKSPCGPCREIISDTLGHLNQADVTIVMSNPEISKIVVANLSDLLPL